MQYGQVILINFLSSLLCIASTQNLDAGSVPITISWPFLTAAPVSANPPKCHRVDFCQLRDGSCRAPKCQALCKGFGARVGTGAGDKGKEPKAKDILWCSPSTVPSFLQQFVGFFSQLLLLWSKPNQQMIDPIYLCCAPTFGSPADAHWWAWLKPMVGLYLSRVLVVSFRDGQQNAMRSWSWLTELSFGAVKARGEGSNICFMGRGSAICLIWGSAAPYLSQVPGLLLNALLPSKKCHLGSMSKRCSYGIHVIKPAWVEQIFSGPAPCYQRISHVEYWLENIWQRRMSDGRRHLLSLFQ